jgi:hypothetical protein
LLYLIDQETAEGPASVIASEAGAELERDDKHDRAG